MKEHGTFVIDAAHLEHVNACTSGKEEVAELLPATVSTDPHDNIALADKLVKMNAGRLVAWLVNDCSAEYANSWCDHVDTYHDGWIIAQWLAWYADEKLTEQGR